MDLLISIFDRKFRSLHDESVRIITTTPAEMLFWQPTEIGQLFPINSCGEYILRSAGKIEQTFGGIMTKLWDDPFEWTLPEHLSSNELILEYLEEVEMTRVKGFGFFNKDDDLKKSLPAPQKLTPLFEILLDTLGTAENFQGRAIAVYRQILVGKL